ncbi:LOW QUALITY PROTEIN: taste receptor type 2 member 5 [Ctenodactylus gundi]
MLSAILGLLMPIAVAEFLIGLVGNGVLVAWSFREKIRKVEGFSYNLIVLGLASCRFLLQWLMMLDLILLPYFENNCWLRYLNIFWAIFSQASLWFATFLSVFYCKKITTFTHPALWLKQRAHSLCLWCLLGHILINLLHIFSIGIKPYGLSQGNSSVPYCLSSWCWHYHLIFQLTVGNWFPVMLLLISSAVLIVSLYRHHRRMTVHTAGRRDARTQAHIGALKSLGCFLTLHLVYIMASPFSVTSQYSPGDLTRVLISETLMAAYPSLHSVVLIMGIPKVRQTCQKILWKCVCAWRSQGQ